MRHTIHVLAELARLNAATHAARKEAERVDFVLNATTNSITVAVRAGKSIDPQDLRYASEYAAEKVRSDRAVAAAKAQDTALRPALVRELRDVTDDTASTYDAIVATLTERYGAPSAEPCLSGCHTRIGARRGGNSRTVPVGRYPVCGVRHVDRRLAFARQS